MAASEISRDDTSGFAPTISNELAVRQSYQLQTGLARPEEEHVADDSLTLTDIGRIILKHKWTLLVVIALACTAAVVRTLLSTPIYRSTVILQIDRASPRVVRFENDPEQERLGSDDAIAMRTQQELLKSRSLAERVIDELRLDRSTPSGDKALDLSVSTAPVAAGDSADPAAEQQPEEKGDYLDRLINGYRKMTSPSVDKVEVLGRESVVRRFLDALTIEPVRSSRLVKVHVDNTDPKLAARIANSTVQAFIAMGMERRLEATSYAKSFLEDQIKQVKAKLEDSERRLNAYAQSNQILTIDDKTSAVGMTYTDFAAALAKAEQERIRAETVLAEVKRNPEASTAVVENKTIQTFKERRAKLMIDYQENLRIFKPDYPKMIQLKAQITEMDSQIKEEITNVVGSLSASRDAAAKQEEVLKARVNETLNQVLTKQGQSIDLNLLKREVDTNRQLYDNLLQRFKELGVSANIMSNNVSVVDAAEPSLFPYKPNLLVNLLIGLVAGVLLGAAIVIGLEVVDDSIKYPDEVERVLGLPLMGIIPKLNRKRGSTTPVAMEVHEDPRSTVAEAYRSVRTALQFSTPEGAPKRLVITSTTRNEGKSTTSLSLAINFAQMGQRVLLIDADMRNPTIHKFLGIPNDFGLSNLLSSDNRGDKMITPTVIPNLSVLTAGPIPPNPVDLLTGPKLLLLLNITAALGIDYVIVDAPPMLGLADAVVLGNQLQNVLYVVRAGSTRRAQIKSALRRLRQAGLVPRGAVLTQTLQHALPQDYESYYGYTAEGATPNAALPRAR
ncbi:polysaccharide biosynthesis tyrosine autokinase [Ramlibacter sp. USB13]|uniref:Putative tyrosine-protein kinase EpsB n=1 Tax=Ramlibacter cellulosilyticus TaxID=2764187 RepID=A0A923S9Z4_9BURK|nr:polysaccharide biosynthesis tyrosine autokinase [Ramlibacter cellulosilyticus]MBC5781708.1 polysaccharide biosynthesis tyrosine autokinase [Ramlibacter cellulosilyticus]